jgi:hypothetical protein
MMLLIVIVIELAMEVTLSLASSLICDDNIILSSLRLIFSPYSFVLQYKLWLLCSWCKIPTSRNDLQALPNLL